MRKTIIYTVFLFFRLSKKVCQPFKNSRLHRFLLRYYYRRAYPLFRRLLRSEYPLYGVSVMWALTYQCQCRCDHCGVALYARDDQACLQPQEIYPVIDELVKAKVSNICFTGGEALLIDELPRYIRYAARKGVEVTLDTNGYLLDEERVRELKTVGLQRVRVSIDDAEEESHDQIRKHEGLFRRAERGIKACGEVGLDCVVSTLATHTTLETGATKRVIAYAERLGVGVRIMAPVLSGGARRGKLRSLDNDDVSKLRAYLRERTVYWEIDIIDTAKSPFFCVAMEKSFFYISAYGDVQPCCYLPLSFGNIREHNIHEVVTRMWSSAFFEQFACAGQCPVNQPAFQSSYGKALDQHKQHPIKYSH